jgi:hypothetical protein
MSNTSESEPDADALGAADVDAESGRLRAVVVTYDGSPDRRTVYPPEATDVERLTHWLTADADAYVRLEEVR